MHKSERNTLALVFGLQAALMVALHYNMGWPSILGICLCIWLATMAFMISGVKHMPEHPEVSKKDPNEKNKIIDGRSFRHKRTGITVSQVYPNSLYFGVRDQHHTHHTVHADFIIGSLDWEEVTDEQ